MANMIASYAWRLGIAELFVGECVLAFQPGSASRPVFLEAVADEPHDIKIAAGLHKMHRR